MSRQIEPTNEPVAPLTSFAALRYDRGRDTVLELDLIGPYPLPSSPLPTIVRTTGAGWVETNRAGTSMQPRPPGARFLAAAGFLVAVVSSRVSWQAPFPAQIHDVKAAIRWLRANADTYPIDPERIGIIGDSAGGHLAALAALTDDRPELDGDSGSPGYSCAVQAAVTISGPTDFSTMTADLDPHQPPPAPPVRECADLRGEDALTQLFGGPLAERTDLMRLASPINYVHPPAPPFLIVHGTCDETVPFDQSERMHHALTDAGVNSTFVPIDGGFHNLRDTPDIPYESPVWDRVGQLAVDFFTNTLQTKP